MILQIFSAWVSDKAPPYTVKSWLEHKHQTPVDHAVAGDHTIAGNFVVGHAEVHTAVLDEHVPLFEGALIQQNFQAFAGCQLALGVLGLYALDTSPLARCGALELELFVDVMHGYLLKNGDGFGSPAKACATLWRGPIDPTGPER